jgi:hypothetical protein
MKWVIFTIGLLLLSSTNQILAEELELFIRSGSVKINNETHNYSGLIIKLKSGDRVSTEKNSVCIIKKGSRIAELNVDKVYKYNDLVKKLSTSSTYNDDFISLLLKPKVHKKHTAGIVTRGHDVSISFKPMDSVYVLSDTMNLSIDADNLSIKLISEIVLFRELDSTRQEIYRTSEKTIKIKTPDEGIYIWTYTCQINRQIMEFENIFFVPNSELMQNLILEVQVFQHSLHQFSEELQHLLLEDFLIERGLYIN